MHDDQVTRKSESKLPDILLLEGNYMLRHALSLNAKEAGYANVFQTANLDIAKRKCMQTMFHGLIVAVTDEHEEIKLIEKVRAGETKCRPEVPILVTVNGISEVLAQKLNEFEVAAILTKPLRIRTIQEAAVQMFVAANAQY
jgi:AmiR/NasT family two-component response regulator